MIEGARLAVIGLEYPPIENLVEWPNYFGGDSFWALNKIGTISLLAMAIAVKNLEPQPDYLLIDGTFSIPSNLPQQPIVKGDSLSISIAAASIIAKVTRDRIMAELAAQHPGYGWERNAGYGTAQHREALETLGVTPHHRRSFRPIHNILV